jgi:hypothetical protein
MAQFDEFFKPVTDAVHTIHSAAQPVQEDTMSTAATPIATVEPVKESFIQKVEGVFEKDGAKVVSIMEQIGKDASKALTEVVKYLPEAATLVSVIFPGQSATATAAVNVVDLIQEAVATVEAKYAAAGIASETGAKKLADVLTLTQSSVTALLAQLNIKASTAYITNIVNAVVALLNVQTVAAAA